MSKWLAVPAVLVVFAMTTSANADWFRTARSLSRQVTPALTSTSINGGGIVYENGMYDGKYGGYPFYSGCCEPRSSCCRDLWTGFCGMRRHYSTGCGCAVSSCGSCGIKGGKGGGCNSCGHAAPGCGHGFRFGLFHRRHAGHGCCSTCGVSAKSGCGCGAKGSTKYAPAATPMYDGTIDDAPAAPTPEPISTQSADRRWAPLTVGAFN